MKSTCRIFKVKPGGT